MDDRAEDAGVDNRLRAASLLAKAGDEAAVPATPAFSTASTIRRASAMLVAIGFSNMLARFGGGDDLIGMAGILGVNHHHVDIVAADKFAPIADELLDVETHGRGAAARLIVVGDGHDEKKWQFLSALAWNSACTCAQLIIPMRNSSGMHLPWRLVLTFSR